VCRHLAVGTTIGKGLGVNSKERNSSSFMDYSLFSLDSGESPSTRHAVPLGSEAQSDDVVGQSHA
jgi:hypothetical protein